jgi:hypothetical protein
MAGSPFVDHYSYHEAKDAVKEEEQPRECMLQLRADAMERS